MITDLVIKSVGEYLESSSLEDLSTVNVYQRDEGADIAYPALFVMEDGDPEEHETLRGVWTVNVLVMLRTEPEGDEAAATQRKMTYAVNCLIGDHDAIKAFLNTKFKCWDVWGGGSGLVEANDGWRETTFKLEIKASESR